MNIPAYIQIFRGKRVSNGKWVYGDLIHRFTPTSTYKESVYIKPYSSDEVEYLVDPDTIGAATGLKDRDGNMMFDGDIVLFGRDNFVIWWNKECFQWQIKAMLNNVPSHRYMPGINGNDEYRYDGFDLGWVAAEIPIIGSMSTVIVGNKYDNPELLIDEGDKNASKFAPF